MPEGRGGSPRILIVKLSAVGDVVHTLPALNALRTAWPDAHIGWAVHPGAANLLEGHPQLDELLIIPREFLSSWSTFKGAAAGLRVPDRRWDIAIDFQGLTKSGIVTWVSRAARRIGFAGEASRELNLLFMNNRFKPKWENVIHMNVGLLSVLGIHPSSVTAVLHSTVQEREEMGLWADHCGAPDEKFLFIDPFAGWQSKLWPIERWIETAVSAGVQHRVRTIVFHGPGEQGQAHTLAAGIVSAGGDAMAAPATTLRQFSALVAQSAFAFVGGDTGPMHIAAAAGVPTVALYGPSDSRRNAPAFSNARYKTLQDSSQPCAGTFTRKCPHHPLGECMIGITSMMVLDALEEIAKT